MIGNPDDFTDTAAGMEKMDAICMMLIVIGEALKNLDKISGQKLLSRYTDVDWKKAKGMRDIITMPIFMRRQYFSHAKEKFLCSWIQSKKLSRI